MVGETQAYRFKVSLRLIHPAADLSQCSSEFALEPSRQWIAGEPRTTPKGNSLEGLRRESFWTADVATPGDATLEEALAQVAQWLEQHDGFIAPHIDSGGSAALFIGFFMETPNTGFSLEPELLEKYSSLGVALGFDMYGPDHEHGPP